jgi:hypothetical protein
MRVCPGCGAIDTFKEEEPDEEDWWCRRCLGLPITDILDDLAEIRPQRPA